MSTTNIPITKPPLGEEEIAAAADAIRSGWVTQGPRVADFENALGRATGARHAVAVSSGTTALHLALLAVGVKPGDTVITVSQSFIATANAVRMCGAEPFFVDTAGLSMNMDPDALMETLAHRFEGAPGNLMLAEPERLMSAHSPWAHVASAPGRLGAILVVHQVGMPADMARIASIAERLQTPLVEDAACALGSRIRFDGGAWEPIGKPHGEVATLSFHPRKIITTGEGGALLCNSQNMAARLRMLRHHGMSVSDLTRHEAATPLQEHFVESAYNYRLSDILAAIGCEQMKRLDDILAARRSLAERYREHLHGCDALILPEEPSYARSNWQSYIVHTSDPARRDEWLGTLMSEGIGAKRGIACAHLEAPYRTAWGEGTLPNSELSAASGLALPLYPSMSDDDVSRVSKALLTLCTKG